MEPGLSGATRTWGVPTRDGTDHPQDSHTSDDSQGVFRTDGSPETSLLTPLWISQPPPPPGRVRDLKGRLTLLCPSGGSTGRGSDVWVLEGKVMTPGQGEIGATGHVGLSAGKHPLKEGWDFLSCSLPRVPFFVHPSSQSRRVKLLDQGANHHTPVPSQ